MGPLGAGGRGLLGTGAQHGQHPGGVVGAQHVHAAVEGGPGVVLPDGLHGLPEGGGVAPPEVLQGADPEGVVHQAVGLPAQQVLPAAVIGDLVAAVLPDLPQQEAVRLLLHHRPADAGDELVRQLVGHVQPPRVRPGPEPAADDGVLALHDEVDIPRVVLVHRRQGVDAPPALVAHRPLPEGVPGDIGALPALGGPQGGVRVVGVEVAAVVAGVVEHAVQHHPDPPLPGLGAQAAEVALRAQHGVDLVVVPGVVAVVAVGLEDGAEVEGGDPQALEVVQLLLDARQISAEKVAVADLAPLVRQVVHQLLPVLVYGPVPQHTGGVRHAGAAEPVREDLIGHPPAEPVRRGAGVVVYGLLPANGLALAAQAVSAQPADLAVLPPEAEAVPHQIRAEGEMAGPGEDLAVPLHAFVLKGELQPRAGKFRRGYHGALGKVLPDRGTQGQTDNSGAGRGAVGALAAFVAGVKYHRPKSPLSG